jgi:hypothetical protein
MFIILLTQIIIFLLFISNIIDGSFRPFYFYPLYMTSLQEKLYQIPYNAKIKMVFVILVTTCTGILILYILLKGISNSKDKTIPEYIF